MLNNLLDTNLVSPATSDLEERLRKLVIGQDAAVQCIVDAYQIHTSGLSMPGHPISNFLFLGPTGTGKTMVVESLAHILLGSTRSVTKVDCSELAHSHEISKLLGSPPGYLGHRETPSRLSQNNLNKFQKDSMKINLLLFDEVEKASDALWNLLLGIMDKATLTLGDNSVTDFSTTMIFMTSNLGAKEMADLLNPSWGYGAKGTYEHKINEKVTSVGMRAVKKKFTPEFINRIDRIVTFNNLSQDSLKDILDNEISEVQTRILNSSVPIAVLVSQACRKVLLEEGTDPKYGARPLKRVLENRLVHPISRLIGTGQLNEGDLVKVGYSKGDFTFTKDDEDLEKSELVEVMALDDWEDYKESVA